MKVACVRVAFDKNNSQLMAVFTFSLPRSFTIILKDASYKKDGEYFDCFMRVWITVNDICK